MVALAATVTLGPAPAQACECEQLSLEGVCREGAYAFAGVVESASDDHGSWLVRVRVVQVIAGDVPAEVDLIMGARVSSEGGRDVLLVSSCDSNRPFEPGAWVRVFMHDATDNWINICTLYAREIADETEAHADPCTAERITRDHVERDERERRAREPRGRGGCASCAVAAPVHYPRAVPFAFGLAWGWRLRRRGRLTAGLSTTKRES